MTEPRKLMRAIIKEEFVVLTGNHIRAVILAQLEYWQRRTDDFDKFLLQERERSAREGIPFEAENTAGWIYKTASDLSSETMLNLSDSTMRSHIQALVESGWVMARHNPRFRWDRTWQYKLDLLKIRDDLLPLGYTLQDWKLPDAISEIENGASSIENASSESENQTSEIEIETSESENQTSGNRRAIPETTSEITSEKKNEGERSRASGPAVSSEEKEERIPSEPFQAWEYLCGIKGGSLPDGAAGKQMAIVKRILKQGYRLEQILKYLDYMASDPYWQSRPWDFTAVASTIDEWVLDGEPAKSRRQSTRKKQGDRSGHDDFLAGWKEAVEKRNQ